jgi:hypothetical protein
MARESDRSSTIIFLLVSSLLAAVVLLPSQQSTAAEWQKSDDKRAKIEFDDSNVDIKVVSRKQKRDKNILMELIALEHKSGKSVGQGQLLYMEITKYSDRYFYDTGISFTKIISKWFSSDSSLEFTRREKAENQMGPYGVQRFSLNLLDCAAIQQFLGPLPIDRLRSGKKPLGTIIIRGYYCTREYGVLELY